MKKLLHLTNTHVPTDARILRELNALSRLPATQLHAAGVTEGRAEHRESHLSGYELSEFEVVSSRARWLPRGLRYVLVALELNARLARHAWLLRPDVVHCHDTMVLPAGVVAKALGASVLVYDAHELESDKAGQTSVLSHATKWIERASWPSINALITVSPSIMTWYRREFDEVPSLCLLNSPEVREPAATEERTHTLGLREKLGLDADTPVFIYVGALARGRGIELVLEACLTSETREHVVFIGDGRLTSHIKEVSERFPRVGYCEPVPHDELVRFIADADGAFCLIEDVSLSDHYCLPNKLFEYAFAGLPVIASRLPDIQRVVDDFHLGVCVDLDREEIRDAMARCLEMKRLPSPKRLAALSWSTQAENLRDFYWRIGASESPGATHP